MDVDQELPVEHIASVGHTTHIERTLHHDDGTSIRTRLPIHECSFVARCCDVATTLNAVYKWTNDSDKSENWVFNMVPERGWQMTEMNITVGDDAPKRSTTVICSNPGTQNAPTPVELPENSVELGMIAAQTTVTVTVTFVFLLATVRNGALRFQLPVHMYSGHTGDATLQVHFTMATQIIDVTGGTKVLASNPSNTRVVTHPVTLSGRGSGKEEQERQHDAVFMPIDILLKDQTTPQLWIEPRIQTPIEGHAHEHDVAMISFAPPIPTFKAGPGDSEQEFVFWVDPSMLVTPAHVESPRKAAVRDALDIAIRSLPVGVSFNVYLPISESQGGLAFPQSRVFNNDSLMTVSKLLDDWGTCQDGQDETLLESLASAITVTDLLAPESNSDSIASNRIVVLVTQVASPDVTAIVERQAVGEPVASAPSSSARLFVIAGVDAPDADVAILSRAAYQLQGLVSRISPDEVETSSLPQLLQIVIHTALQPCLHDITVDWGADNEGSVQQLPRHPAPVMRGERLVIFAAGINSLNQVTIRGRIGSQAFHHQFSTPRKRASRSQGGQFDVVLHHLAGRTLIDSLLDENRRRYQNTAVVDMSDTLRKQLVNAALAFSLPMPPFGVTFAFEAVSSPDIITMEEIDHAARVTDATASPTIEIADDSDTVSSEGQAENPIRIVPTDRVPFILRSSVNKSALISMSATQHHSYLTPYLDLASMRALQKEVDSIFHHTVGPTGGSLANNSHHSTTAIPVTGVHGLRVATTTMTSTTPFTATSSMTGTVRKGGKGGQSLKRKLRTALWKVKQAFNKKNQLPRKSHPPPAKNNGTAASSATSNTDKNDAHAGPSSTPDATTTADTMHLDVNSLATAAVQGLTSEQIAAFRQYREVVERDDDTISTCTDHTIDRSDTGTDYSLVNYVNTDDDISEFEDDPFFACVLDAVAGMSHTQGNTSPAEMNSTGNMKRSYSDISSSGTSGVHVSAGAGSKSSTASKSGQRAAGGTSTDKPVAPPAGSSKVAAMMAAVAKGRSTRSSITGSKRSIGSERFVFLRDPMTIARMQSCEGCWSADHTALAFELFPDHLLARFYNPPRLFHAGVTNECRLSVWATALAACALHRGLDKSLGGELILAKAYQWLTYVWEGIGWSAVYSVNDLLFEAARTLDLTDSCRTPLTTSAPTPPWAPATETTNDTLVSAAGRSQS